MKKKYIVGDLVRYTSLCKEPVAEICEVCETSYLIRFMNGNFARVTNEEIKPLPLTTKILEKNGWKKVFPNENLWKNRDIIIYDCLSKDNSWCFKVTGFEGGNIYFKFVHQLQHLLFGLGINHEMEV